MGGKNEGKRVGGSGPKPNSKNSDFGTPLIKVLFNAVPTARHLLRTLLRTFSKALSRTLLSIPFSEGMFSHDPLGVHPTKARNIAMEKSKEIKKQGKGDQGRAKNCSDFAHQSL